MPEHPAPAREQPAQPVQVPVRLLDKDQTAALLCTTPRHVERLVEDGRLGYVKVGRFVRFSLPDIERYLDSAHVAPREQS